MLLFPLAALLNSFSMTALLLAFGLFGRVDIAADIGLVQGASLALFYAFSANARNVVLAAKADIGCRVASVFLLTRLVLLFPLAYATYFLCVSVGGATSAIAIVLILRRACEWISEIALARLEVLGDSGHTLHMVVAEAVALIACIAATIGANIDLAVTALPWALVPLLSIRSIGLSLAVQKYDFGALVPHFGSTGIIGASVFVFRLSVVLLAGKALAGTLFTAFAIGGLIPTVFGQALAPTLMHRYGRDRLPYQLVAVPIGMLAVGGVIAALSSWLPATRLPSIFWLAAGLSVAGGAFMSFAMLLRTRLLHSDDGREVFGPDLLANVLLTSCVPFAFHAFGPASLSGLYLFGAFLSLFFLWGAGHQRGLASEYHRATLLVLGVFLTLPLFFQLDGGLFRDPAFVFDTEGGLLRVPLPVSLLAVFGGIALLGNYKTASRTLTVLFFSALVFVMTSLVAAKGDSEYEGAKLALLAQYLLPMFGLVLGEMYGAASREPIFERAACWVLLIILPAQLVSTWLQGYVLLSPKIGFFSIYQHLQYFPMIVSALSILAVISLWARSDRLSPSAAGLMLISSIYVISANSLGALIGLILGWIGYAFLYFRDTRYRYKSAMLLLASLVVACLFSLAMTSGWLSKTVARGGEPPVQMSWDSKLSVMMARDAGGNTQPSLGHLSYWRYYVGEILESPRTLSVGHPTPPDRKHYPSAHNYWLDVAYNFGLLALLPVLGMLVWTMRMLWLKRAFVVNDPLLFATALTFFYLFFVENTLKVGLRQPYPGILSYFIWGLLVCRIGSLPVEGVRKGEVSL